MKNKHTVWYEIQYKKLLVFCTNALAQLKAYLNYRNCKRVIKKELNILFVHVMFEIDIYKLLSFLSDNSFLDGGEIKFYTIYPL